MRDDPAVDLHEPDAGGVVPEGIADCEQMPERLIPARQSQLESIEFVEAVGSEPVAVARASMDVASLDRPAPWVYGQFEGAFGLFGQAVDKVISEDWLAREALEWAQQEADKQR